MPPCFISQVGGGAFGEMLEILEVKISSKRRRNKARFGGGEPLIFWTRAPQLPILIILLCLPFVLLIHFFVIDFFDMVDPFSRPCGDPVACTMCGIFYYFVSM